jgi:hypothetical protein
MCMLLCMASCTHGNIHSLLNTPIASAAVAPLSVLQVEPGVFRELHVFMQDTSPSSPPHIANISCCLFCCTLFPVFTG